MRGEHSDHVGRMSVDIGSSPHARGALDERHENGTNEGIIPACAGSTPLRDTCEQTRRDHPRMRGEHTLALIEPFSNQGSSPHARGAHRPDD